MNVQPCVMNLAKVFRTRIGFWLDALFLFFKTIFLRLYHLLRFWFREDVLWDRHVGLKSGKICPIRANNKLVVTAQKACVTQQEEEVTEFKDIGTKK